MNTERNEVATTRFYNELRKQIDGTLPAGHVYRLGNPGEILRSAGIPDLSIEMNAARLSNKSTQENHPFNLEDMMGLPDAVQKPLAVFDSATHSDSFVILTELRHGDLNYVVALQTNRRDGNILVNSIRSIYPKESSRIVNWINKGLLRYANKKGMADWISRQRSNSADAENPLGHEKNPGFITSLPTNTATGGVQAQGINPKLIESAKSKLEDFQNPPCI